jgi:hypothetical protein
VATVASIDDLCHAAAHSAVHLETRDSYMPADPDWLDWQAGRKFDPAERWRGWFDLVAAAVARGVAVRRARIVSEPVSDYVRFEHEVTPGINLAAGEQVRWLPRRRALDLMVPVCDLWLIDNRMLAWNRPFSSRIRRRCQAGTGQALKRCCPAPASRLRRRARDRRRTG